MRFGLDVAQQRMPWDEVVSRVQLAEELGFDGAWGFDHLRDGLEIVVRLSAGGVVPCAGRVVSLRDAQLQPPPVRRPHPPIWIGGSGPRRTLPLVARYADVWHTWGTPNSLRETNDRL